ncbi:UNVERIFIED_CONTAM: Cullin-4 [Sesamum radiatum]|uniref:Cullin-4 n=1 Tax=Sesamum radiatum TaxID=300843 RepID=A0AAW2LSK6_SESRA
MSAMGISFSPHLETLLSFSYNEELSLRFHNSSMSQPTTSTSTSSNPSKRSASPYSSSTTTTGAGTAAAPIFPAMKKAKSQAVACSLDGNKNGQQQIAPHVHFAEPPAHSPMIEDDPNDVALETSSPSNAFGRGLAASAGGVTANLSRKKATPPQPTKKLVIKLVKAKLTLPNNFEENTWATLKSAISAIFLKQPDPCDLEKLYQAVNDLCLHKMGRSLYQRIEKECEAYISAALQSLVGQSEDLLFRKHLSLASEVEHKTVFGLLKMIESERLGEAVDRTLLNHLLKMFTALGIYPESFEKPFLEGTSEFYAAEGVKYMQQADVPDYLKHVEVRLQEEHERCLIYLDASTRKPLVATAEKQLLERHISAILDKGFMMLMDGKRIEDLKRMYMLFSRVNALESLRQSLSQYIRRTGQSIVMDEEKDKDMVSSLLEFKANLDRIWEESFYKNEAFSNTIKDSFEHLINIRQNRPAELIAKFVDEKLRAGNKGTSEEELEGTLDKVLVLFRFIQGKDVFEAFYKKDLAKRLLLGKSASIDAEKSMITKDIELSKEINESFKQSSQARTKLPSGIEMSVHVLTTGYWPTYPPMDVRLPLELNVYQTVVLMLFNDAQKLGFQDIKESTGIEDKELRRTLQSLACGKFRVLQKVNAIQMKETVEENTSTTERVFQDRQYQVDAAIVRIMKTRKVLSHTLLITELFQQCNTKVTLLCSELLSIQEYRNRREIMLLFTLIIDQDFKSKCYCADHLQLWVDQHRLYVSDVDFWCSQDMIPRSIVAPKWTVPLTNFASVKHRTLVADKLLFITTKFISQWRVPALGGAFVVMCFGIHCLLGHIPMLIA